MSQRPRVLYVTSRFPSITTTFIANEMAAVQSAGCDVHVASLFEPLPDHVGHEVELPFLEKTKRFPVKDPQMWRDVLRGVRRRPRVLGTICLLYTSPSPRDQRGSRMPSSA